MSPLSERELTDRITNWIRENRRKNGSAHIQITADTDLVATGLLDSLGFADLVAFVEGLTGRRIDLIDADLSELTTANGLSRVALKVSSRPVDVSG